VAVTNHPTKAEIRKARDNASEAVTAALLISGAEKQRYGCLKNKLANNYLLKTNQYPNTFEKALQILENYQVPKSNLPVRASPSKGVAFIQQGQGGERTVGQGRGAGRGLGSGTSEESGGGSNSASTSGSTTGVGVKTNSQGEAHCYNYGETGHWAHECPHLSDKQQQQLHMNLNAEEGNEGQQKEAHYLLHVALAQGVPLPNNRAYLDRCSNVMVFKNKKFQEGMYQETRDWVQDQLQCIDSDNQPDGEVWVHHCMVYPQGNYQYLFHA
jgi:hypothetical protein